MPTAGARDGASAIFLAIEGQAAGIVVIADLIKPTAPKALERLRADGLRIVMLTGDNSATADGGRAPTRDQRDRG